MPVFFVNSQAIQGDTITIQGLLQTHLTKSLRYRSGDLIWCGDEQRQRYQVRLSTISQNSLIGKIVHQKSGPPPPKISLILGLALLKGDHMNWAIQKATELGVQTIVPLTTNRCVARPGPARVSSHQERWQRIALDAAQQSERWDYPSVELPCDLDTFLASHRHIDLRFILLERGASNATTDFFFKPAQQGSLVVISGPEGGWTDQEIVQARENDFREITFGTNIFRAETAPLVALSLIQYQLGYLG